MIKNLQDHGITVTVHDAVGYDDIETALNLIKVSLKINYQLLSLTTTTNNNFFVIKYNIIRYNHSLVFL